MRLSYGYAILDEAEQSSNGITVRLVPGAAGRNFRNWRAQIECAFRLQNGVMKHETHR